MMPSERLNRCVSESLISTRLVEAAQPPAGANIDRELRRVDEQVPNHTCDARPAAGDDVLAKLGMIAELAGGQISQVDPAPPEAPADAAQLPWPRANRSSGLVHQHAAG